MHRQIPGGGNKHIDKVINDKNKKDMKKKLALVKSNLDNSKPFVMSKRSKSKKDFLIEGKIFIPNKSDIFREV